MQTRGIVAFSHHIFRAPPRCCSCPCVLFAEEACVLCLPLRDPAPTDCDRVIVYFRTRPPNKSASS